MKSNVTIDVVGCRKIDFTSDSGDVIKMTKLTYNVASTDNNVMGIRTLEINTPYETFDKFVGVKFPVKVQLTLDLSDLTKKPIVEKVEVMKY